MLGRQVTAVRVTHGRTARRNASPQEVERLLAGRRVESVGRRGKFLLVGMDDGHTMVAHLGMSGRFHLAREGEALQPHTHFVATLDDGVQVRFIDPRTFGFVGVFDQGDGPPPGIGRLGPDAWDEPPGAAALARILSGRTAPIKALLLDQRPLSGLGNIYADEALHRAGIHPLTPAGELGEGRLARMLDAVRSVLEDALEAGGTTLDDLSYLLPDGRAGENLGHLAVYGREGRPCPLCGAPVERLTIRGRSSHFCPVCQPR